MTESKDGSGVLHYSGCSRGAEKRQKEEAPPAVRHGEGGMGSFKIDVTEGLGVMNPLTRW